MIETQAARKRFFYLPVAHFNGAVLHYFPRTYQLRAALDALRDPVPFTNDLNDLLVLTGDAEYSNPFPPHMLWTFQSNKSLTVAGCTPETLRKVRESQILILGSVYLFDYVFSWVGRGRASDEMLYAIAQATQEGAVYELVFPDALSEAPKLIDQQGNPVEYHLPQQAPPASRANAPSTIFSEMEFVSVGTDGAKG